MPDEIDNAGDTKDEVVKRIRFLTIVGRIALFVTYCGFLFLPISIQFLPIAIGWIAFASITAIVCFFKVFLLMMTRNISIEKIDEINKEQD